MRQLVPDVRARKRIGIAVAAIKIAAVCDLNPDHALPMVRGMTFLQSRVPIRSRSK